MTHSTKKHFKKKVNQGSGNCNIIWGIHPIFEMVRRSPEKIIELRLLKEKSSKIQEIIQVAERNGVAFHTAEKPYSETPENAIHQGILARIKPIETFDLPSIIATVSNRKFPKLLLALDNIQDPHNFGAMIRTASAAGVSGIIYTKDRSAPLSGTVAKVSAGAINHLPLCPITNMANTLQELKKQGFWIFGADGQAQQTVFQTDFAGPACLVIGGEGKGLRPLVKKHCDFLVSIPMQNDLDSLNASIASAVILFEAVRQQLQQVTVK